MLLTDKGKEQKKLREIGRILRQKKKEKDKEKKA